MSHPQDDERGLVLDLLLWFGAAVGVLVLAANFDQLRQVLSKTVISNLERALPEPTADGRGQGRKSDRQTAQSDEAPSTASGSTVELKSDRRGHFQADVEINGRRIEALVDTGASLIVLTYEDANRVGIYPNDRDFTMRTQTANGIARAAPVMLDRVEIGSIQVRNVQAAVAEPGRLATNLLGNTFLSRLKKFEISSGRLVLQD